MSSEATFSLPYCVLAVTRCPILVSTPPSSSATSSRSSPGATVSSVAAAAARSRLSPAMVSPCCRCWADSRAEKDSWYQTCTRCLTSYDNYQSEKATLLTGSCKHGQTWLTCLDLVRPEAEHDAAGGEGQLLQALVLLTGTIYFYHSLEIYEDDLSGLGLAVPGLGGTPFM